jgi:hypothetical protein
VETVFSLSAGTNATASSPTAYEKFGVGKRPNGSDDDASLLNRFNNTPRPNAKEENKRNNKRLLETPPSNPHQAQTARGHAAKLFSRIFATDPDVTMRADALRVRPPDTAATIAARPYVASPIVNANGCAATLPKAASNAGWNTNDASKTRSAILSDTRKTSYQSVAVVAPARLSVGNYSRSSDVPLSCPARKKDSSGDWT